MGGYAALMLSRRLGAFASVSLSPQIMILPENAPFESRWQADRKSIKPTFKEEQRINENISRDAWVFLDSEDHLEVPHYQILRDEISQATNPGWKLIDVPFAGHPVSACLQQIGVLEKLIMGLLTGKPPVLDEVRDKCRQAHLEHPKSLLNFLRRCEQVEEIMRYGSGAVSLYERADQRDPEVHYMAAEVFLKLGLMDAALKASSRSLETSPELPHILQKHAVVLDKVHGHSAALEFLAPYLERHVHAGLALQVLQLMKQLGLTTDMHKLEFALKDKLTLTE
jgi:tetratricopeptide (TPR) repeat protein